MAKLFKKNGDKQSESSELGERVTPRTEPRTFSPGRLRPCYRLSAATARILRVTSR